MDYVSVDQELGSEVPRGSVFGLKIYCMYTKPVSDIIPRHGLSHHSYADDTQLYMTMGHFNNAWRDEPEYVEAEALTRQLNVFTSKYKQDLYNYLSIMMGGL